MKYISAVLFLLVGTLAIIEASSGPAACSYKTSQGETVFLTYMPLLKKGEDYVDFDTSGKCIKRAICTDTFKTEIEPCSKYPVTCTTKKNYNGVFPACCVKC